MTALIQEHGDTAFVAWSLLMVLAGFVYGYARGRARFRSAREGLDAPPPMPVRPVNLSPAAEARLRDALGRRRKIEAIRILREETGLGLKDAKEQVEAMDRAPPGGG